MLGQLFMTRLYLFQVRIDEVSSTQKAHSLMTVRAALEAAQQTTYGTGSSAQRWPVRPTRVQLTS